MVGRVGKQQKHQISSKLKNEKSSSKSSIPLTEKDQLLIKWFTANGIEWDKSLLLITRNSPVSAGLGIVAKESVRDTGLNLVKIPRECILSPKNCGIADLIEEQELAGVLALTLALMFEMSLGVDSPWYGYLQSLPSPMEPIAAFWTQEQLEGLAGTCLSDIVKEQKACILEDFEMHIYPLVVETRCIQLPGGLVKQKYLDLYVWATSCALSRAFEVDSFNGDSMVPFADLFNHSVVGEEHVNMQNDFDLCRICGEGYCDCDILLGQEQYSGSGEKGEDDDEGRDYEEFDYDRPLFDEYNAPILFGEEGEGGDDDDADDGDWEDEEDLEQEIDKFINGDDNDNESGAESEYIEMNSVRPLVKSQEIFNIFGKLSNTCLLMRYGFSQSGNPFDVVNFTIDYFTDFLKTHWKDLSFGNKEREWDQDKIENRIKLWQLLRPFAQALEEENKEGEEEDGGGEQEEEEEDVSDDHGHCSSGNCSDHHHHGHAHDDEEEEEERPDPFALTLDVKGIPDSDLILFLAIMFASSRLLQAVSEDQDLAIQWVKQILHANSLQGDVVWKGTGAVWTVDNNNDGESDDLDDDNNNNVMVPSTVPSTTYQKIALALTLLAEHRLEKLGGNKEEDVMALNLLSKKQRALSEDEIRRKFCLVLRTSEFDIWRNVRDRFRSLIK